MISRCSKAGTANRAMQQTRLSWRRLAVRSQALPSSASIAGLAAARWAKEAGITVVLDGDTMRDGIDEPVKLTDVLIASRNFAVKFTGEDNPRKAIIKMHSLGPEIVGVTLGADGCVLSKGTNVLHKPAFKVDVVDTTGAGDVFHGAFIYGLLKGWSLETTAQFSSAVSAIKCMKLGGRAGISSLGKMKEFLTSRSNISI